LRHLAHLWGYPVVLDEIDEDSGKPVATHRQDDA